MPEKSNFENQPEIKNPKVEEAERLADQKVSPEMVDKINTQQSKYSYLCQELTEKGTKNVKIKDPFTNEEYELGKDRIITKQNTNDKIELAQVAGQEHAVDGGYQSDLDSYILRLNGSEVASMSWVRETKDYRATNLPLLHEKLTKFIQLFELELKKRETEKK